MTNPRWSRRRLLAVCGAAAVAGCSSDPSPDPNGTETTTDDSTPVPDPTPVDGGGYDLSVEHDVESWEEYAPDWEPPEDSPAETPVETEVVVENLAIPWDLSFAPDGDLFISERPGTIVRYDSETLTNVAEADVLDRATAAEHGDEGGWWAGGSEGGLMGIAAHPNYPEVPLLYAYYTYNEGEDHYNRLVYYDVSADDPSETETTILDDVPGHRVAHNGARVTFGPANYLWVTTGDAIEPANAQNLRTLAGKVLRMEPDGTAPDDNPDLGDDADPRIYTYGHRNPQGIAFFPDGTPLITEHGESGQDEVNVLRAGGNYGWGGFDDVSDRNEAGYEGTDYERPVANTGDATWAPPGCVFYTGDGVSGWRNRLVVGGLISQRLNVVTLYPEGEIPDLDDGQRFDADWMDSEYDAVAHAFLEDELGRIRHVEQGPDGALYAVTSNRDGRAEVDGETFIRERDDVLVRITPAE